MQPQGLIYVEHDARRNLADLFADTLDGHARDLLGLSLRVLHETSNRRVQQHLKRINTLDV